MIEIKHGYIQLVGVAFTNVVLGYLLFLFLAYLLSLNRNHIRFSLLSDDSTGLIAAILTTGAVVTAHLKS